MPRSPQQEAVIRFVREGLGSAIVRARAGTGKTFTLLEAMPEMQGRVAYVVFNNRNSKEAETKVGQRGLNNKVVVGTFHKFGFDAWRMANRRVQLLKQNGEKTRKIIDDINAQPNVAPIPEQFRSFVVSAVSHAKKQGFGIGTKVINDPRKWLDLVAHNDLDQELTEGGFLDMEDAIREALRASCRVLKRSIEIANTVIDFDDMLYMPLLEGVRMPQYDWVLVDEAQDSSPVRRAMASRMLKPGGRALFVGDDRQAIYGFCHPPGTKVRTPEGLRNIEELKAGDPIVIADTSGNVCGFGGKTNIIQAHIFDYDEDLIELDAYGRKVEMTIHHRVPVKIDLDANYFTYLMERNGVFRVGYMAAYANAGVGERRFMLSQRCTLEGANKAWLLMSHYYKAEAQDHEAELLRHVKGTTFNAMTDEQVSQLSTDKEAALELLAWYGRRYDFPFWNEGVRQDFKSNHAFVIEACNIMEGMRVAFLDMDAWDPTKRGKTRQMFDWTPVRVNRRPYTGKTYGITVPVISLRPTYSQWPLYFAGNGEILVHNTGADNDALDIIRREFDCAELPLTVTYRCPKAVVELARQLVPDYEAHPDAPEGEVLYMEHAKMMEAGLHPGDAIICRNTASLVDIAFTLIRKGIACHVEGREIGRGLKKLATKWTRIKTLSALLDKLDEYEEREVNKAMAAKQEEKAQQISDKVETLRVLASGFPGGTVADLVKKIDSLFGDLDDPYNPPPPGVMLMTAHKSKGLEFPRVFLYGEEKFMPSRFARQDWQHIQEQNLIYVAYTRAEQTLVRVRAL